MLKYSVGTLLGKGQDVTKQSFDINERLEFCDPGDPDVQSSVTGKGLFLKLPHEIHVKLSDLKTTAKVQCSRCLIDFEYTILVPVAAREFVVDLPEHAIGEDEQVEYVNRDRNQIDLEPMIRQEIILHFPPAALCSPHCRGLCDQCGVDLNRKNCSCTHPEFQSTSFKIPSSHG